MSLLTGDFIEEDDGEYGADMGEEDDFFTGDGDKSLAGKKRKDGAGKGGWQLQATTDAAPAVAVRVGFTPAAAVACISLVLS